MARVNVPKPGQIFWNDLTVPNAEEIRRFYAAVVGWKSTVLDGDFNMTPKGEKKPAAGVCWARGVNRDLPPVWLPYIRVADLDRSVKACRARGGTVVHGPRPLGEAWLCVIRDPAGASAGLYGPRRTRTSNSGSKAA